MTFRCVMLSVIAAVLATGLLGCGSDQGGGDDGTGGMDGNPVGCSQPFFPADQPDISPLAPPRFVTRTGETQLTVAPGLEILAEITVNAPTRRVRAELRDSFFIERVIATEEVETPGNETIAVSFMPVVDLRGRFYMRLTLCGPDCDEREVLFDIVPLDLDNQFETGINADYERTVIEQGDIVRVDSTCVRPNSVLIQ